MTEEIKEISGRIIKARETVDRINCTNQSGLSYDEKVKLTSDMAEAKIALRRAKREYEDYILDEINKP